MTVTLDQPSAPPAIKAKVRLTIPSFRTTQSDQLTAQRDQSANPIQARHTGNEAVDGQARSIAHCSSKSSKEKMWRFGELNVDLRARDEKRNGDHGEAAKGQV